MYVHAHLGLRFTQISVRDVNKATHLTVHICIWRVFSVHDKVAFLEILYIVPGAY